MFWGRFVTHWFFKVKPFSCFSVKRSFWDQMMLWYLKEDLIFIRKIRVWTRWYYRLNQYSLTELNLSTAMNNLVSKVSALILTVHTNDLVIISIDFQ